jgi:hypothetical protein
MIKIKDVIHVLTYSLPEVQKALLSAPKEEDGSGEMKWKLARPRGLSLDQPVCLVSILLPGLR